MTGADDTAVPMKPEWLAQRTWDSAAPEQQRALAVMRSESAQAKPVSMRRQLLNEAADLIDGGRDREYGGPEKNFERIAGLWSAAGFRHTLDGKEYVAIAPHQVAIMMILVKQARLIVSPRHKDSWTDTGGYAGCGFEVAEGE